MALAISRLCIRGEGDAIRHLESITKWSFSQRQYPLERFHYPITNIATDFRDGIRLTKIVELLSSKNGLTPLLQWPAKDAGQRVYNLNIALNAARSEGIPMTTENQVIVQAKDVEIGDREKTLAIPWNIIHHWCLPKYLAQIHLSEEVTGLKKLFQIRKEKAPKLVVKLKAFSPSY